MVDRDYGAVLRVILFYIWRGCSFSRKAGLTGKTDPSASLISLSAYEATLGIIQLIRIGYHADAIVLIRALLERIAIVGWLGENRPLLSRYFSGELKPYKEAFTWAKKKPLPNWVSLYSTFSDVAHSRIVGPAGHINNRSEIGFAFREVRTGDTIGDTEMAHELLGLVVYSLVILDPLALILIENAEIQPLPKDICLVHYISLEDIEKFQIFLQELKNRFEGYSN